MAIADMFLKVQGVTGEARDADHKGEIDVVSWSWGMQAPTAMSGEALGRTALSELLVVKRVDQATPALMALLRNHKIAPTAQLSVRKAGTTPLEVLQDRAGERSHHVCHDGVREFGSRRESADGIPEDPRDLHATGADRRPRWRRCHVRGRRAGR